VQMLYQKDSKRFSSRSSRIGSANNEESQVPWLLSNSQSHGAWESVDNDVVMSGCSESIALRQIIIRAWPEPLRLASAS
jgi:hypothetical protein